MQMVKWLTVVSLVVTAAASFPAGGRAQRPETSVWSGVYSDEQAERGRVIYAASCARCHGRNLEGVHEPPPPDVQVPEAYRKPALANWEFRRNWNGLPLGDLIERIRISMPQENPGSLRRPQIVNVSAYMLQQNGYPSGSTALPADMKFLNAITFEGW
jgi:cytochrome c553